MCRKSIFFILVLSLVSLDVAFAAKVIEIGITNTNDSVEDQLAGGMYLDSSDLEFPDDGGLQVIGLRFLNVEIPKGANIIEAYIVFTVDEVETDEPAHLIIEGELVPDASQFESKDYNVDTRTRTDTKVQWDPEHYDTEGVKVQTSDISSIIKEIVDQDGWAAGNNLAIIISDNPENPSTGLRTVESGSGEPAPLLHVKYSSNKAYVEDPRNGSIYLDTWASLNWSPGDTAASSDVYFSDILADVETRAEAAFRGNQTGAFLVVGFPGNPFPDGLVPGTTYYWRIDSIEADGTTTYEGDIWSFMVAPKTAYSPEPAGGSEAVSTNPILRWTSGFGAKLHTVYFGESFEQVDNATGGLPLGFTNFSPGELKMAKTYYWRVDEFDGSETHKGNIWSFTTVGAVTALNPVNGAVDVSQTPVLTWAPGFGDTYEIYFGADTDTIELKASGNLGAESFEPGQLEWNTTYYWRVDEANSTNTDSPWTGPLWSFTTANFLIIDDMEAYNDLAPDDPQSNRIFNAWLDGFDDPTNGSLVGFASPPFAEQTIVHTGSQSMPFEYDNSVGKSEATLTLTSNNDWTVRGVNKLAIWYRGSNSNAAETMYVTLNGSATVDNDNPQAALVPRWNEWNIDLTRFNDQGVNLSNVTSITIGLRSVTGGTGMLYIDDIRLYLPEL